MGKKIWAIITICILILTTIPIVVGELRLNELINKEERLDLIFKDIYKKIDNAESQVECNHIFKQAVFELYKYELLGEEKPDEIIKLISSDDENSYSISGKSSKTEFIGTLTIQLYYLREKFNYNPILEITTHLLFLFFYIVKSAGIFSYHFNSWVALGLLSQDWEGGNKEWEPAQGWIKIVDSNGSKIEYNTFYGQIEPIFEYGNVNKIISNLVGIKGFKGIRIGDYYLGTAMIVDVGPNHPDF